MTDQAVLFSEVVGIFSDVLNVPRESLNRGSSPETIGHWDSVLHLNLVLSLEERYGVEFEPDEMDALTDLGGFVSLLEQKLNQQA